ncbi:MAG: efflux RND transporter permease subunit [Chitinophagales bacterium]|nr:efflux RND transporter permease subunit [Chitinophagales bacterium]
MSITSLSVKRPTLVVVFFTILGFFGIISYHSLKYELLPEMSFPVVMVTTIYPGAGPGEVESTVSKVIENEVSGLENIDELQSYSLEGVSIVVIKFKHGTDPDISLQNAQRKINAIRSQLPDDIEDPALDKFSFDDLPIMKMGVTADISDVELNDLLDNKILPDMARVEGVAQVSVIGNTKREIRVDIDLDKLESHGLSLLQVTQAIQMSNMDFPTGRIKNNAAQYQIRLGGKFESVEDIRNLIVANTPEGNNPIYMYDIADVYDGTKEVETLARINGAPSVGLMVVKQKEGNTVAVSEHLKEKILELEKIYSDIHLKFKITSDNSDYTLAAADAVTHDLIIAVILVAVIMLLFLHSLRNAFIVMVSIPLSIVSTFVIMNVMGFSLNLMTLLALTLVVGILVDDSIVVIENIYSHLEKGLSAKEAALKSWDEIGISVASITLVIIVVFLPIGLVQGMMSDMLKSFSFVVAFATFISLIVSFTVTPLLASKFAKLKHLDSNKFLDKPIIAFEKLVTVIRDVYLSALKVALRHKAVTVIGILAFVFLGSYAIFSNGLIGQEFVKEGDSGDFILNVELPKETPIEKTNELSMEIEKYLLDNPLVQTVFTTVGMQSSGMMSTQASPYVVEFAGKMIDLKKRTTSVQDFVIQIKRELFYKYPGVELRAHAASMTGGGDAPVQVVVQGTDLKQVLAYGDTVKNLVNEVAGTVEVKKSIEDGNPEVRVDLDRKKMADLGVDLASVGATLQYSFSGNTDSKFRDGQNEYDINVRLDKMDRADIDNISRVAVMNNQGQLIKLSQFANIELSSGPSQLERFDKVPSITVTAQVAGVSNGVVLDEISKRLDELDKPLGISTTMIGEYKYQAEASASLGMAFGISIVLVYLIMVALYESYAYPFVVMFSIPVAMIGAFLALALNMENLSIFGMLGVIMLVGLVVKNAILIVDFANHLKKQGMPYQEAIIEASLERFRPILMTTIAMVIAMIPVALAKGEGAEWKNGLAWILIGGLLSSMLFTIIIVPVMYNVIDGFKAWWAGRKEKNQAIL